MDHGPGLRCSKLQDASTDLSLWPLHLPLSTLIPLRVGGQLWHGNRKALLGISSAREKGPLTVALAVVLGMAVVIAVLPVVSLAVFRVGAGVLLLLAVVPALCQFPPWRSAVNYSALERWKKTLSGCQFPTVADLAMYPQTGEGFTFARAARRKLVPSGAALDTEARSRKHLALDKRAGLQPWPGPCGTTTLAEGTEKDWRRPAGLCDEGRRRAMPVAGAGAGQGRPWCGAGA